MLYYLMLIEDEDDKKKFEKLYFTYRLKMQYVAFQILKDTQEAENMVHDTFVTLIDYLDKIDEADCHGTWNYIVTILKNKCFNFLKRNQKITYLEDDVFELSKDEISDMILKIIQQENVEVVAECIQKLKYPYKEVIYLKYYNGLSSKEIGRILGMTADNVRQTAKRAKKKLKDMLLEMGYCYED